GAGPGPSDAPRAGIDLSRNHPPALADGPPALARTLGRLAHQGDLGGLLGYAPDGGAPAHRAAGAAWLAQTGGHATPDNVLVTSGTQHAMMAVFAALTRPGDLVLTEALTYPGVQALTSLLHLRVQGVAMDEHGLRPDAFAAACRSGAARALYTIP